MTIHGRILRHFFALAIFGTMAAIPGPAAKAQEPTVPDFRHVRVDNPAKLSHKEAETIYQTITDDLAAAFESSGVPEIQGYTDWRRYNSAPYMSSTHGNRFINNYGNSASVGYDRLKKGDLMSLGSVLIKDSFAVTQQGAVIPGRLFVMEKLSAGSHPATGDWRYMMIGSDGMVIADTVGETAKQAEFCHVCHKVRSSRDFLFYVPPDFRLPE